MNQYTASQVAAKIGCNRSTVYRVAVRHGIGQDTPLGRLYSQKDVAKLRKLVRDKPGNPQGADAFKVKRRTKP